MQNLLLAAHDRGLGAMMRTGPATTLPEVLDFLDLSDNEHIAAFVYLGYPLESDDQRPLTRRTDATSVTEWRGP